MGAEIVLKTTLWTVNTLKLPKQKTEIQETYARKVNNKNLNALLLRLLYERLFQPKKSYRE